MSLPYRQFMRSSVSIQRSLHRAVVAGAIVLVPSLARQAGAQQQTAQSASNARQSDPFATTTVKRVAVSKSVFGDAGIIVNARDDGFIEVAAAGPKKSVLLQLRTLAARAWVDSTSRMMKARARKADGARTYRSDITEYGTGTTMALTREVNAGASSYALAFAENPQSAFTIPIEPEEADVFVAIIRKAVAQSAKMLEKADTTAAKSDSAAKADSAAAAKPKKKKPAVKRVAPPPATDSSAKAPAVKAPAAKPPAKP